MNPRNPHKVRFPNGTVIHSYWYTHPWLTPSGKIRANPAASKSEISNMEKAYREWLGKRA